MEVLTRDREEQLSSAQRSQQACVRPSRPIDILGRGSHGGERLHVSSKRSRFRGEGETKACAARGIVESPQATSMRLDYGAADAEAHGGSTTVGRNKRIR